MGGCRCTYRNCTVKSDGTTHMFHYPVFDKVRCHQWLTNAQRLEFLNLKVSQLKNRVVCQHHFKNECFMNFLKDKLTFEAVPTEDGPFCDSSQLPSNNLMPEVAKVTRDYIENEYLSTIEKKANFSVKYGDFLTNCEVMDMVNLDTKTDFEPNILKKNSIVKFDFDEGYYKMFDESDKIISDKKFDQDSIFNPCLKPILVDRKYENPPNNQNLKETTNQIGKTNAESKKIKIISETKLSQPIKFTGTLKTVSPSIIIEPNVKKERISNKKDQGENTLNISLTTPSNICKNKENTAGQENSILNKKSPHIIEISESETCSVKQPEQTKPVKERNQKFIQITQIPSTLIVQDQPKDKKEENKGKGIMTVPVMPNIKSKIAPARVAAIEEKRKFNMKLRDKIKYCLENLNDRTKDIDYKQVSNQLRNKQSESLIFSQQFQPPNIQECNIASLEARLKRMEDTLLNKINQNSEKIAELKESITTTKACYKRKGCVNHIEENEKVRKSQLYQEISKYLSEEAKSLIYEELFINKYAQKLPSPNKRRKKSFVNIT